MKKLAMESVHCDRPSVEESNNEYLLTMCITTYYGKSHENML